MQADGNTALAILLSFSCVHACLHLSSLEMLGVTHFQSKVCAKVLQAIIARLRLSVALGAGC